MKHNGIQSTLDFRTATGAVWNRFDGRRRPDKNRDSQLSKTRCVGQHHRYAFGWQRCSRKRNGQNRKRGGLEFKDHSNLSVGPSSQVRLDKFVYDPNKGSGTAAMEAVRGTFRFATGAQNKGEVKIKTPSGDIGIRG